MNLVCEIILVQMHCYDVWTSAGFQVARLPKTEYTMTKFPATQCHCMFHGRVLTLVLLGGVEAFPTVYPLKPGVMGGRC
jgi:hypothetical protein